MNFTLDGNKLFTDAVAALQGGIPVWVVFALIGLIMLPLLIPALSNAIAQQRQVSHKREQQMRKIRNSIGDRAKRLPSTAQHLQGPPRRIRGNRE